MYKLVHKDGAVLMVEDGTTEIHFKDAKTALEFIPENESGWFVVPINYAWVRTMSGMNWGPPGQRGV